MKFQVQQFGQNGPYTLTELVDGDIRIWNQDAPDDRNWKRWLLVDNGYGEMEIYTRTTRKRGVDYSGGKQYRVNTKTEYYFVVRGNSREFTTDASRMWAGERSTLRELCRMYKNGELWKRISMDAETECHKQNVDYMQVMGAVYGTNRPVNSDKSAARNLIALL